MKCILAISLSVGILSCSAVYLIRKFSKKKVRRDIPTLWKEVGNLTEMTIYPIKSCHFICLNEAECTAIGLRSGIFRDRYFMVIDDQNNFVTARKYPVMVRIFVEEQNGYIVLTYENMDPLILNPKRHAEIATRGQVWGGPVSFYDCGEAAAQWFSRLLIKKGSGMRLVCYGEDIPTREVRHHNSIFDHYFSQDTGALQDDTSYGLINLSSVDDLNAKIAGIAVNPLQFRPNFFIKGAEPFDEDNWSFVKIGKNVFEISKPCQRCSLTTIDPETGVKRNDGEPLTTLKTYRKYEDPKFLSFLGEAPRMGVQMALRSEPDKIFVNDIVYAA